MILELTKDDIEVVHMAKSEVSVRPACGGKYAYMLRGKSPEAFKIASESGKHICPKCAILYNIDK